MSDNINFDGWMCLAKAVICQAIKDYQRGCKMANGEIKEYRENQGELLKNKNRSWIENKEGNYLLFSCACKTSEFFQKDYLLRLLDFIDEGNRIKFNFNNGKINYLIHFKNGKTVKGSF